MLFESLFFKVTGRKFYKKRGMPWNFLAWKCGKRPNPNTKNIKTSSGFWQLQPKKVGSGIMVRPHLHHLHHICPLHLTIQSCEFTPLISQPPLTFNSCPRCSPSLLFSLPVSSQYLCCFFNLPPSFSCSLSCNKVSFSCQSGTFLPYAPVSR